MSEINVELLVQTFNEKIASLTSELIVKETMIKQLNLEMQNLVDAVRSSRLVDVVDEAEDLDDDSDDDDGNDDESKAA